ncbi:MAG: DNA/RNA non-specific endonuclease [Bacteroidetes bacterium]|jgi:endonuclease G|nr:DNA/RNA non-specific endonuclease [Bacteroidota bacterium]
MLLLVALVPSSREVPIACIQDVSTVGVADSLLPQATDSMLVRHRHYALSYRPRHGQAEWVAYWLADTMLAPGAERRDRFRSDPSVPGGSARPSDYRGTGFDKGHLCPAADMSWDSLAMEETFYMSNMSPQSPAFNRGIWKELEEFVRSAVRGGVSVFVITGPVLADTLRFIGRRTRVSIPAAFYKIIYRSADSTHRAAAFLLANAPSASPFVTSLVTIDSIEAVTGIDFFNALEDSAEQALECRIDTTWWGGTPTIRR